MIDFGQLLAEKAEVIVDNWVEAVRQDRQITSANELTQPAIRNHIPYVLAAIATVLCESEDNNVQALVKASLEHGVLRAEQGFDPKEIAREYGLLRWEIFTAIQPDLLHAAAVEIVRVFRLIDAVVDEAIAQCFKSYTEERLRELMQLQSQLELTNQELTRLVRASQENLSLLAHELKTPLNSIIGYSELFLRQHRQSLEIRDNFSSIENIERVLRNGRGLLRLVNNALELSRCEVGRMQLHLNTIDVQTVLGTVLEMMEPLATAKGLILQLNCDRAPQSVVTDPLRLQQIMTNLLSNAIRYTETGTIQIDCQTVSAEQWLLAIADTGIGIAPHDQSRIFEPFFRVNDDYCQANPTESTGLGLAIVTRLVKLLQGKIELVSQVGVGSTFTVLFPIQIGLVGETAMTALNRADS